MWKKKNNCFGGVLSDWASSNINYKNFVDLLMMKSCCEIQNLCVASPVLILILLTHVSNKITIISLLYFSSVGLSLNFIKFFIEATKAKKMLKYIFYRWEKFIENFRASRARFNLVPCSISILQYFQFPHANHRMKSIEIEMRRRFASSLIYYFFPFIF